MSKAHIVVAYGGWSSEREVSLNSGKAIYEALQRLGYRTTLLDVTRQVAHDLERLKPDCVFNALHGTFGEDGTFQGLLEMMDIDYTHSGVLASALAMHKPMAKLVFKAHGLPVADDKLVNKKQLLAGETLPEPYVVKPIADGSSVGVQIVREDNPLDHSLLPQDDDAELLLEPYIPGREIQVAVLNGKALGAIEIRPKHGWYDYKSKYTAGMTDYLVPAPINQQAYDEVCALTERAHTALGCEGLTRSDFRYDDTSSEPGKFYLLELNTQPGMTTTSLCPKVAAHRGMSFDELVQALLPNSYK